MKTKVFNLSMCAVFFVSLLLFNENLAAAPFTFNGTLSAAGTDGGELTKHQGEFNPVVNTGPDGDNKKTSTITWGQGSSGDPSSSLKYQGNNATNYAISTDPNVPITQTFGFLTLKNTRIVTPTGANNTWYLKALLKIEESDFIDTGTPTTYQLPESLYEIIIGQTINIGGVPKDDFLHLARGDTDGNKITKPEQIDLGNNNNLEVIINALTAEETGSQNEIKVAVEGALTCPFGGGCSAGTRLAPVSTTPVPALFAQRLAARQQDPIQLGLSDVQFGEIIVGKEFANVRPVVPEPNTLLLFGTGIFGVLFWRLRQKRI